MPTTVADHARCATCAFPEAESEFTLGTEEERITCPRCGTRVVTAWSRDEATSEAALVTTTTPGAGAYYVGTSTAGFGGVFPGDASREAYVAAVCAAHEAGTRPVVFLRFTEPAGDGTWRTRYAIGDAAVERAYQVALEPTPQAAALDGDTLPGW